MTTVFLSECAWLLYFFEISPRRDLILSRCTLQRNFEGGEISRAATGPLTRLAPAHSSISIVRIAFVRLLSAYFESDDPFPCGEISRAVFIGTNLLIGAVRFWGWRNFEVRRDFEEIRIWIYSSGSRQVSIVSVEIPFWQTWNTSTLWSGWDFQEMYHRSGFNCEYLLNANCEFFYVSQLIDSQT